MKSLFIVAEAVPYCKTGSLADVVHGLARELNAQGHDVRIAIPCYRGVLDREHMQLIVSGLSVPLGTYAREATVWKSFYEPLTTYLIQYDFYFGRDEPYGYLDDYERFIFFNRAVLEALSSQEFRKQEDDWFPEVIQGYDWTAGLIPGWLHEYRRSGKDGRFAQTRFVLSVNNIERLGIFGTRALRVAKQEETGIFDRIGKGKERISFLKRGIMFADKIVIAPPYCGEGSMLPKSAQSLKDIVTDRFEAGDVVGIRGAIDYSDYDPSSDIRIRKPFNEWNLRDRIQNKLALQEELGFEQKEHIPMLGMVSRLCSAKGFDLFTDFRERILNSGDVQLVVLADPEDPQYMRMFGEWEQDLMMNRGNCAHHWRILYGFEERLARRIYAGSDIFLIPSKEESSGIQQFIVMHYGAVPVTHKTGILRDSVEQYELGMEIGTHDSQGTGIGFAFADFTPSAFCDAVQTAINLYRTDRKTWRAIQRRNIRTDFSWFDPAKKYLEVYKKALLAEPAKIEVGTPLELDRDEQLLQAILEIDSLPGLRRRDSKEMLRQAASLVRDAIQCDAVYVWALREGGWSTVVELAAQDMQLVSESLDRSKNPDRPYVWESSSRLAKMSDLLNQRESSAWNRFVDLDPSGICKPILNLKDSEFASEEKWVDGLSVPITAHSRVLGKIDALFVKPIQLDEAGWFTYALTTLANSFGFRLEAIRLKFESDQIWEMGNDLLSTHSFADVVQRTLERVHHLLRPDGVELYLFDDNDLKLVEAPQVGEFGLDIARSAVATGAAVYAADNSMLHHRTERAPLRSFMAVPLVVDLEDKPIGALVIASEQPASFSRDDERVLVRHLAPQAATALHVNCLREERERNRIRLFEERDQGRVNQLKELAASLVGGGDFTGLCNRIVYTTAKVLEAQAASLYMLDEKTDLLTIQAAAGYHIPQVEAKASYEMGEGTTGWTAQTGEIFKADSEEELRAKTPLKGKYTELLEFGEPDAFLAIPLKVVDRIAEKERVIGVLKIERWCQSATQSPVAFSDADVRLGEIMTNIIATVIYNVKASNDQLQQLSSNLQELSKALAGGREMQDLVKQVVETMARVLGAKASSLYLIDDATGKLVIRAATGYQKSLVGRAASYDLGEGITGWIASEKGTFRANSRDELSRHVNWKGKQDKYQEDRQPDSFLGMPLEVMDRFTGEEKVIGVLKVEDIQASENHPEAFFTDQDVLLVTMMANVIATVVYNTQVSNAQLGSLSSSLQELSVALAGGREMQDLVEQVVETMARVLGAKASSLYLIDDATGKLVIRAATGYQRSLVGRAASYDLGEGITGWIASEKGTFRANSHDELSRHVNWKGKQDKYQGGLQPDSFLGMPLEVMDRFTGEEKVIGVLKVEDIVPSENHPEDFCTDQDVLLVTMMANIIATFIYNTRQGEERIGDILQEMGMLSSPVDATSELLGRYARSTNSGIVDQLAIAIASRLSDNPEAVEGEARTLFAADANIALYRRVANWAQNEVVKWKFSLFHSILDTGKRLENWEQVIAVAQPWLQLANSSSKVQDFADATCSLVAKLANVVQAELGDYSSDASSMWFGTIMETSKVFGMEIEQIPILFQRQGALDETNVDLMRVFAQQGFKLPYQVVVLVLWDFGASSKQIERMQDRMRIHAIDVVVASIPDILHIFEDPNPTDEFRGLVLRQVITKSPFIVVGPVPDTMFFGRARELREIVQYVGAGRSCVLIGGRRIGKSSILSRLHRVRLPEVGFRALLFDGATVNSYEDFLAQKVRSWRPEPPPNALETFEDVLGATSMDKQPLVLLLDEADKLVFFDRENDWQLFKQLRALSNSGRAQTVLCGERVLREVLRDPGSPLFNFANEILLGPLNFSDVDALVTRPFKRLQIELKDERAIVNRIYAFTSGHPNVIQRLCRRLLDLLNEQRSRRITLDSVDIVIKNPGFQRDDFLSTYWEAATPLEKIISLLMADDKQVRTLSTVQQVLVRRCGLHLEAREIDEGLQRLVDLRSILRRIPTGYEFAVEAFSHVVADMITLDDMLKILAEEYQEQGK